MRRESMSDDRDRQGEKLCSTDAGEMPRGAGSRLRGAMPSLFAWAGD